MKNENYITIQGWMVNELNLKGNELIIYAIIYGFTQDNENWFEGSQGYLREWCNASRDTVIKSLNKLIEKKLIIKETNIKNNVKLCRYKVGVVKSYTMYENHTGGCTKIIHNNYIDNNKENNNNKLLLKEGTKKQFEKPSIEDIQLYCWNSGISIEAEKFYYYYESNGWMVGRNKMKDWKAAVRTWQKNNFNNNKISNTKKELPQWKIDNPDAFDGILID